MQNAGRSQRWSIVSIAISTGSSRFDPIDRLAARSAGQPADFGIPSIRVSSRRPDLRFFCVAARARKRGAVGRALSCASPASTITGGRFSQGLELHLRF